MADDDLIAQLRNLWEQPDDALDATVRAAADEIERLRAVIAEALAAFRAAPSSRAAFEAAYGIFSRALPDAAEPSTDPQHADSGNAWGDDRPAEPDVEEGTNR